MAKKQTVSQKLKKKAMATREEKTLQNVHKTEKKKTKQKAGRIGALGDIVFTVSEKTIRTFNDLEIDSETNYAKHIRHNKKPLLEFQYNDTDKASFTIYLATFLGVSPKNLLIKIEKYRVQGKILSLVIGGERYGTKWVITKHSKKYEKFDNKGNLLAVKSSISLEEYPER